MKKKLISTLLVLSVLCCVFLSACNSEKNAIVGKWEHIDERSGWDEIYHFKKNGTVTFTRSKITTEEELLNFTWKYNSKDYYDIISTNGNGKFAKITIDSSKENFLLEYYSGLSSNVTYYKI